MSTDPFEPLPNRHEPVRRAVVRALRELGTVTLRRLQHEVTATSGQVRYAVGQLSREGIVDAPRVVSPDTKVALRYPPPPHEAPTPLESPHKREAA